MTDEKMDARLRAAGERWRVSAENTTVDAEDASKTELLVHLPRQRSRHRWLTFASAAVVTAALVLGGLYFLRGDKPSDHTQPFTESTQKLVGTTWTMPVSGQTLVFTQSQVTSRYLCTKRTTAVRIDAGRLTIGKAIGQFQDCSYPYPGDARDAALRRYSAVMTGAVSWSVDKNVLTLTRQGVGSISFTRPVELSDLAGTTWGVAGTRISLVFEGNTMRASDGCYSATSVVTVDGGRATRGRPAGQASACSPPSRAPGATPLTEDRFDAIVQGSFQLSLDQNRLTLSKTGAGTITLSEQGAAPELVGTTWHLSSIVDGSGVSLSHVNTDTTFRIDARGALTTDDQCGNAIGGTVTNTDTTFTFTDTAARTEIGCADQVLNKGAVAIGDILSGTVAWSIRNNTLVLTKPGHPGELAYEVALTKPPVTTLAGTSWNLTSLTASGSGPNSATSQALVGTTVTFSSTTLTLDDSCFVITGRISYAGSTFTLSGVRAGDRPNVRCDINEQLRNQQANLRKLLADGVVGWSIDGGLTLTRYNLVAGFSSAAPSSADPLAGTSWRLADTSTETTSGNSSSGGGSSAVSRSNLTFGKDGRFTLEHKCYSNAGDYSIDGQTITLSKVHGAGAIPCPSNAESFEGQQENNLVDALLANGSATFTLRDGVLTIKKADHTADFSAQVTGAAALRAAHWTLTGIRDGSSTRPASGSAEFDFAGKVVAAGQYTIPARLDDTTITITGGRSGVQPATKKSLNAADERFVYDKLLTGTVSYTISGDTLTITKAGVGALVLTRS